MGKGQNKTGGKKGKRAGGGNRKYGANNKDVLDITSEQSVAEIIKHYGGTPPRFKGIIISSKNNGKEVRIVKPGSTRGRVQMGDIALIERNIANSISSEKQEFHILTILRKDQVRQLKLKGVIVREDKNNYEENEDFEFDAEGLEEDIVPQQRRYSFSSDDEFNELIGEDKKEDSIIENTETTDDSIGTTDEIVEKMSTTKVTKKKIKEVDDNIFGDEEIKSFHKTKDGKIIEINTSDEITNLICHTPPVLSDEEKRQLKKSRYKSPSFKNK